MNASSTSDSWIGCSIGEGRYLLQERLGSGSMGDVFTALDTRIGQIVAIKILKSHWAETEDLRRRFEHEVALCAALKSEHIVQIRDYGINNGHPYYVMECLAGQTLGDLMRQQRQLPVGQAVNFLIQTCSGLERAHAGVLLPNRGETVKVVHRDLKPDNIFIAETSIGALVKILDFGIAKIQNMQRDSTLATQTNMFIGTFHYASPEQVEVSRQLNGRSDIYSLGVILYEMLSGTNPFGLDSSTGEISQMSWAVAHSSKPAIALRSQPGCDRLSPQLEAVVMRCLEKDPQDRFATVQTLQQALQAALQTEVQSKTAQLDANESIGAQNTTPTAVEPQPASPIDLQPTRFSPRSPSTAPLSAKPTVHPPDSTQVERSPSSPPQPAAQSASRLPLMPVILGFLAAIGLSGIVLGQLLSKPSAPPPSLQPIPSQVSIPDPASLPVMVCNELPLREISGKPALQQPSYKYYGTLKNGQFIGQGTLIFSGFRYDGDFQNGKKQGCGRFTYPPHDPLYREYIGQFQDDFPDGIGTLVFSNGTKYVGQVKTEDTTQGKTKVKQLYCQGEGVLVLTSGEQISGTWEKGKHQESQGKYACDVLPP